MINRLRQRKHRGLMKIIRTLNKNIAEDTLWRGRFKIYLLHDRFYEYEDSSGGTLFYYAAICDLKTGECGLFYGEYFMDVSARWRLFQALNNFITNIPDVIDDAKNDNTNYTEVVFAPPSLRDFRNKEGLYML